MTSQEKSNHEQTKHAMTNKSAAGTIRLNIGVVVNPIAGVGGQVGLKGSDDVVDEALDRGAKLKAATRLHRFFEALHECLSPSEHQALRFFAVNTDKANDPMHMMGWASIEASSFASVALGGLDKGLNKGLDSEKAGISVHEKVCSTREDTIAHAQALQSAGIDLLLFVGGDGTARALVDAQLGGLAILGIPAGVKMYSGVFATSPEAAAQLIQHWLTQAWIDVRLAEVRDIDEQAIRANTVSSRYYGELSVPQHPRLVQCVKTASSTAINDIDEIAEGVYETMVDEEAVDEEAVDEETADDGLNDKTHRQTLTIIGAGTTTLAVKQRLDGEPSLLGCDAYVGTQQCVKDGWSAHFMPLLQKHQKARILLSPIGGQGFLFGRGNQQLSAELLRLIVKKQGKDAILVLATRAKLAELNGRPLLVDTGDRVLDKKIAGFLAVQVSYDERILYPVQIS